MSQAPVITTFTLGPYETNCFVVTPSAPAPAQGGPCWIVDCGFEPEEMFAWIEQQQLKPRMILLTHAHCDHIAGVDRALIRFGKVPIAIHEAEAAFCTDPLLNLSILTGVAVTCTAPDRSLKHDDMLELNGSSWRVLHTPGHSPGGACFVHDESKQAIVGDAIFAGSVGRTDFPTSNPADLRRSLDEVIMKLPDDMTIHPGHGPATTIGRERSTNPYVRGGF